MMEISLDFWMLIFYLFFFTFKEKKFQSKNIFQIKKKILAINFPHFADVFKKPPNTSLASKYAYFLKQNLARKLFGQKNVKM